MPLPHWLARVNLVVTNRLTMPLAGRLPWFGVMEHVGRRSGVLRRTPLNVFASGESVWVVALTYGPGVQWLRNIEASGECRMLIRGRWLRLVEPRRFRDPRRSRVPLPVRWALALLRVDWFVEMREARRPAVRRRLTPDDSISDSMDQGDLQQALSQPISFHRRMEPPPSRRNAARWLAERDAFGLFSPGRNSRGAGVRLRSGQQLAA